MCDVETFADGPSILVTFLSAGPQLEEIVLIQTEQAVSVDVDHLEDVRQHLPVARWENDSRNKCVWTLTRVFPQLLERH